MSSSLRLCAVALILLPPPPHVTFLCLSVQSRFSLIQLSRTLKSGWNWHWWFKLNVFIAFTHTHAHTKKESISKSNRICVSEDSKWEKKYIRTHICVPFEVCTQAHFMLFLCSPFFSSLFFSVSLFFIVDSKAYWSDHMFVCVCLMPNCLLFQLFDTKRFEISMQPADNVMHCYSFQIRFLSLSLPPLCVCEFFAWVCLIFCSFSFLLRRIRCGWIK